MTFEIFNDKYPIANPKTQPDKIYIRYGLFANMRRSTNHSTGKDEQGVSVYRARFMPDGSVALDEETCPILEGQGRLCFAVVGREVGIGSDGEPLLRGIKAACYPIHLSARRG